jgi:hypothetical protein
MVLRLSHARVADLQLDIHGRAGRRFSRAPEADVDIAGMGSPRRGLPLEEAAWA